MTEPGWKLLTLKIHAGQVANGWREQLSNVRIHEFVLRSFPYFAGLPQTDLIQINTSGHHLLVVFIYPVNYCQSQSSGITTQRA
jgi:hypothetical protein